MKSILLPTAALVIGLSGIAAAQTTPPAKLDISGGTADDNTPLAPDVKLDPEKKPGALPGAGAVPAPEAEQVPEDDGSIPRGLEKLTPADRKEVKRLIAQVSNFLGTPRQLEAWEKIDEADKVLARAGVQYHVVENLRGAVKTKLKDYKAARAHFVKAAELAKDSVEDSYHPRFNIAELDFVEKKWDAARDGFTKILSDHFVVNAKAYETGKAYLEAREKIFTAIDERDAAIKAAQTSRDIANEPGVKAALAKLSELRKDTDALENIWKMSYRPAVANEKLIHFKLYVTELQAGKADAAAKHEAEFDRFDLDSPAYYYAKAAEVFIRADKLPEGTDKDRLKEEAQEWMNATKQYPEGSNQIYLDTFIEMGWVQSLGT